jgi:hypothetical protein
MKEVLSVGAIKRYLEEIVPKLTDKELLERFGCTEDVVKFYRECFGEYEGDS